MKAQGNPKAPDWATGLPGLVFLAGCAAMAAAEQKAQAGVLPSVEADRQNVPEPGKEGNSAPGTAPILTPEALEFMRLPPRIQRHALDYARKWMDANYERTA